MDQPDGCDLSAIDRALRDLALNTDLQPDEFTIYMLIERQPTAKRETLKHKLAAMVNDGELSVRYVILNGSRVNAYKYVK